MMLSGGQIGGAGRLLGCRCHLSTRKIAAAAEDGEKIIFTTKV
jgi:hypothetical protein